MASVLDANVWLSALKFGGKPFQVVQMALDGAIDLVISQSIMDETLRVLCEKFGAQPPELDRALTIMEAITRKVEPTITLNVVKTIPRIIMLSNAPSLLGQMSS